MLINIKCPKCGAFRGARQLNFKQVAKRAGLGALLVGLFFILSFLVSYIFVLPLVLVFFITPFWSVAIGKEDRVIKYKCNLCKNEFKVKNYRNKEVQNM